MDKRMAVLYMVASYDRLEDLINAYPCWSKGDAVDIWLNENYDCDLFKHTREWLRDNCGWRTFNG